MIWDAYLQDLTWDVYDKLEKNMFPNKRDRHVTNVSSYQHVIKKRAHNWILTK